MPVTHVYVSTAPAVSGKVDSTEWNRAHTVSITNADIAADASIALTKLAAQAANSILAEGTGSSASPTAITVGEQTLVGRITGGNVDDLSITQVKTLLGVPDGSGTATQVAVWSDSDTLADGNLIPPANLLTLVAAAPYTLTIPETMTVAGRNVLDTHTRQIFVDGSQNEIQLRIQAHSTQTANILTLENSSGTEIGAFTPEGNILAYGKGAISTNFAAGTSALGSNTSGASNFAMGLLALNKNTTGNNSVAIGSAALYLCTGSQNIAIGANALRTGTTAYSNTLAIGYQAGYSNTGSNNIYIGALAGFYQASISNMLFIANQQYASAAAEITNSIIHGVMASTPESQTLRINAVTSIYGGLVGNEDGGTVEDFRWETDSYDGIFLDASNNSVVIMSNAAGKVGFFGATAIVQPANTVAIDTLLTNLGLRATGGTAFFDNRLALPMGEIGYFSTTGTAVVITTVSDGSTNMVKAAVTTTLNNDKDFDNGGANDGRLRYTGATTRTFHVACTISMSHDGANDVFVLGVAKNGTVDADCKVLQKITTAGDVQSTAIHCMVSLAQNDYVELYVGNITDANDAVIYTLNIFAVGM